MVEVLLSTPGGKPPAQLLQEVWGHDFFGGTRTVDVHVRRLWAKSGPEYEALIGTAAQTSVGAVRVPCGAFWAVEGVVEADAVDDDVEVGRRRRCSVSDGWTGAGDALAGLGGGAATRS
ncbi:winged helix-turn-helix domain-containing protein [Mycolicibacterium sp.]|uniref:winged helix-turn-helix domain-containing protein n=1 Tax=Mycolicibacterium sp. TaxID=2320850 RepID=UPI0025EDA016|nr:winged helix-turn-helix domain-containing protein [Mycolicibacterium sp.]